MEFFIHVYFPIKVPPKNKYFDIIFLMNPKSSNYIFYYSFMVGNLVFFYEREQVKFFQTLFKSKVGHVFYFDILLHFKIKVPLTGLRIPKLWMINVVQKVKKL